MLFVTVFQTMQRIPEELFLIESPLEVGFPKLFRSIAKVK